MKKMILWAALVLPMVCFGQKDLEPELIAGCKYLQVVFGNDAILGKTKLKVTYGNAQLMKYVVDEKDKEYSFLSWGHAYDFMDKQGWVFMKDEKFNMNGSQFMGMIFKRKE